MLRWLAGWICFLWCVCVRLYRKKYICDLLNLRTQCRLFLSLQIRIGAIGCASVCVCRLFLHCNHNYNFHWIFIFYFFVIRYAMMMNRSPYTTYDWCLVYFNIFCSLFSILLFWRQTMVCVCCLHNLRSFRYSWLLLLFYLFEKWSWSSLYVVVVCWRAQFLFRPLRDHLSRRHTPHSNVFRSLILNLNGNTCATHIKSKHLYIYVAQQRTCTYVLLVLFEYVHFCFSFFSVLLFLFAFCRLPHRLLFLYTTRILYAITIEYIYLKIGDVCYSLTTSNTNQ